MTVVMKTSVTRLGRILYQCALAGRGLFIDSNAASGAARRFGDLRLPFKLPRPSHCQFRILDANRGLTLAATMLLTLTASSVACAYNVNSSPTLPGVVGPNEILNMGTSLVLIIVAIVAVGWLYSRAQGMRGHNGDVFHVLATQPLGPKERVLLVEVAGKQLILGITASQIQTLHVLEQPFLNERRASLPSVFAERLRTAIKGARK